MKKLLLTFGIALILSLILSGCSNFQPDHSKSDWMEGTPSPTINSNQIVTKIEPAFPLLEGPLLLLQTDFFTYNFLDVQNYHLIPFDHPGEDQQVDLKKNISPSRSLMLLQINDHKAIVMSLISGKVVTNLDISDLSNLFSLELAVREIEKSEPELNLSGEELHSAVTNTYTASLTNFKWLRTDQYLLGGLAAGETRTCLHIYDLQHGSTRKLESENGFVEDFWVSPDNKRILLKKGFINDPFYWQDDRYFLLNLEEGSTSSIQIPEDAQRPSLFWFSAEHIGIIHQSELVGGNRFSLFNVRTMESQLIIPKSFTGLINPGEILLSLHQADQPGSTILNARNFSGEILGSMAIEGACHITAAINNQKCLITCEGSSYLLELENFTISLFGDPIRMISFDPERDQFLVIDQDDQVNLCQGNLKECQELILENEPIEILWLPDSSGFLYRTGNRLFYFDLKSHANNLLLTSGLFTDYRNLNAVWVNISDPENSD